MDGLRKTLGQHSDMVLVACVVGILLILFTPIPSPFLDLLIIANLSFALLILLLTFYVDKPLKFSTFPSLLLIATLFRLSLNIAATRLILSNADAGQVIKAVGSHVVGGNYIIGLIVFLVLIVVQYVVVTNGAQRVAEVAARFTLDSMPGKQMAIDADLNVGLIDEQTARERRKEIEKEGNFYGAMDGASKFVKGDAIAGIIIVLIDIVGGLAIGIAQRGMAWGDALHTFTLLTIGDGIVTQIPALIISTGTGIIVTRAASDAYLSKEISNQITAYPKTLLLIALGLFVALFLPGIPVWPVLVMLTLIGGVAYYAYKVKTPEKTAEEDDVKTDSEEDIYQTLTVAPVEILVGPNLVSFVSTENALFMDRIGAFRKQYALDAGFVIPRVRIKDSKKVGADSYEIKIHGAKAGGGELKPENILAIDPGDAAEKLDGLEVKDPTYGLPAVWITQAQRHAARSAGYTLVEPITVLITHLSEIIRRRSSDLLNRAETERLVERVRAVQPSLVEELIPGVLSLSDVQKVLQRLLKERVSIRNLDLILEVLVDYGKQNKDPEVLTELVREKLGPVICQTLANDQGELHVLTFDPSIEQSISSGIRSDEGHNSLVLEPKFTEQVLVRLAGQVEKMMSQNLMPVLLCAPELRRHIQALTGRVMPHLSVISMTEIPNSLRLKSFGMVTV